MKKRNRTQKSFVKLSGKRKLQVEDKIFSAAGNRDDRKKAIENALIKISKMEGVVSSQATIENELSDSFADEIKLNLPKEKRRPYSNEIKNRVLNIFETVKNK